MQDERLEERSSGQSMIEEQPAKSPVLKKEAFIYSFNADEILNKYEFLEKLGEGSYGMVMKAKRLKTEEMVAIKLIKKRDKDEFKEAVNEVSLLRKLDHPNIVKLHEIYENDEYIFLVQELCECNMIEFFAKKGGATKGELQVLCIKLLSALSYCHKRGVIHRDIKFENIVFGMSGDIRTLKLIDFGLATLMGSDAALTKATGTAIYLAPEVISGEYDQKADVWSLGVLLYYLVTGSPPFTGSNTKELYMDILQHSHSKSIVPEEWVKENPVGDLIQNMLVYDPEGRMSSHELLRHPWLYETASYNQKLISTQFFKNIIDFIGKKTFLKLLSYQYATRWKDTYCEPLKSSLDAMDTDLDGIISLDEFKNAIIKFNRTVGKEFFPTEQLDTIFSALDLNNNGQIDYTEFQMLFCHQDLSDERILFEQFDLLDVTKDGKIDYFEIKNHFDKTNLELTKSSINEMIREIDSNGDGMIDFEELKIAAKN